MQQSQRSRSRVGQRSERLEDRVVEKVHHIPTLLKRRRSDDKTEKFSDIFCPISHPVTSNKKKQLK